jgi:pyruvate kinase
MAETEESLITTDGQVTSTELAKLATQVQSLLHEAAALEGVYAPLIKKVHPAFVKSAQNLLHYLSLRNHDLRRLQTQLSSLGLSSLGRAESHVVGNLTAVLNQLLLLQAHLEKTTLPEEPFLPVQSPLKTHIEELLGQQSPGRENRIMVTFSTDLAKNYDLVRDMVKAGMNCARINCAHDDKKVWRKMVKQIKKAEAELGQKCMVLFDLMGPKLRTGPLKPGPEVVPVHPIIDEVGQVLSPAKVWLAPAGSMPPVPVDATLAVSEEWLALIKRGDEIKFLDTRRRKRTMPIVQKRGAGLIGHLFKSAYLASGTVLHVVGHDLPEYQQTLMGVPPLVLPLVLRQGQELILHKENIPGAAAVYDKKGQVLEPAHISCTLPEVFSRVKAGEPILFDDGEIEGVIAKVNPDFLRVKIISADEAGSKLRPDKGINLPESDLGLDHLTEKDKEDLSFVVKHADIVNLSFVSHPQMVEELQHALAKHKADHVGIMLKIETKAAFSNLPHLLLTLMRTHPVGIMIARGDLAVELGWKRLAEVQEEILWIAEAAHLPVVWATQVLEKLTKKGRPSRAEITDAAMAQRADCVMLNKGPFILKSIAMLDDIMRRMQEHQYKKTALLRMLQVSEIDGQLK